MNPIFTHDFSVLEVLPQSAGDDIIDWGLTDIKAPYVWPRTKGAGVKVAVLDTGVDPSHPDLAVNIKATVDFTRSAFGVTDKQGHGTHCAGIIAGADNGKGIIGVAPEAELYIAKVLGDYGSGGFDSILKGLAWALDHDVDVISMSFGCGMEPPSSVKTMIQEIHRRGIIMVAATGNENTRVGWPAAYDEVIGVSAVDHNNQRASFSNFGVKNMIAAPGVDILSTYKDGGYARLSGTSMATPMIAGSIALYMSRYKTLHGAKPSVDQVIKALENCVTDLGAAGKDDYFGLGLINLEKLLD